MTPPRLVKLVCSAWLAAGLLSSVMGLLQYFDLVASLGLDPWVNGATPGVAYANLRQRNQFASLTNISFAALIWFLTSYANESREVLLNVTKPNAFKLFTFLLCMLAVILLMAGNAVSSSRTGALQLVLLIIFSAAWGNFRQPILRWTLFFAIFSYCFVSLMLLSYEYGVFGRMLEENNICAGRRILWANTIELIGQRPWLGWGWGEMDYAHYFHLYSQPRFCGVMDNAHNLPLHLAVELGVPVAISVCGIVTWLIFSQRPFAEKNPSRQLAWVVIALIGFHSLLEYPLWYGPFQTALVLCCVLLYRKSLGLNKVVRAERGVYFPLGMTFFIFILLALSVFAFKEYNRVSQIFLPVHQRDEDLRENTIFKINPVFIFRNQLQFAELTLQPVTPTNARMVFHMSQHLLHYSPEPAVIEKLIQSAAALQKSEEIELHLLRYQFAFPEAYAEWAKVHVKLVNKSQIH